jgi:peroxiredoxin
MRLEKGGVFPTLRARRVGGGELTIPDDLCGQWGVLLFYRGHWSASCRRQLIDFQDLIQPFSKAGARVVALSADDEEHARRTAEEHELTFPVLYGLDVVEMRDRFGAYIHQDPSYVQAMAVVLRPDGTVAQAVYSTGSIGRLVAADTVGWIKTRQKQLH